MSTTSDTSSEHTDLITELVNWDFHHVSLIRGDDLYLSDKFSITKGRYSDGALKITVRIAPEIEKILTREKPELQALKGDK